jgi:hypothetical protein
MADAICSPDCDLIQNELKPEIFNRMTGIGGPLAGDAPKKTDPQKRAWTAAAESLSLAASHCHNMVLRPAIPPAIIGEIIISRRPGHGDMA